LPLDGDDPQKTEKPPVYWDKLFQIELFLLRAIGDLIKLEPLILLGIII
jgi:hypothetical protein